MKSLYTHSKFVWFSRPAAGFCAAVLMLLALAWLPAPASGQDAPSATPTQPAAPPATEPSRTAPVELSGEVDEFGNAHFTVALPLPREVDGLSDAGQADAVRERVEQMHSSYVIKDLKFTRDDKSGFMNADYSIAGFARYVDPGTWQIPLWALPMDASTEKHADGIIELTGSMFWGATGTLKLTLPQGQSQLAIGDGKVTYNLQPAAEPQDAAGSASVQFDPVPRMMSVLSKSYAYEDLHDLWAGRAVLTNTGHKKVTDFRARFRIPGYAEDWSNWSDGQTVISGQTAIQTYFPVLDVDKMVQINGTRTGQMEMQYEYTLDGKKVTDTQRKEFELMGHNEVVFRGAYTSYELASMVTKDDPVVQRVAAMVSSQIPGGFAAQDEPEVFIYELYRFMQHNKIAYQSPPAVYDVQHVKYARDVILNRAGTCVDLAIFYASVCEAVGLHPMLYCPPGHCFPGLKIYADPAKGTPEKLVEIEATCLGPDWTFPEAIDSGTNKLTKPKPGHEVETTVNVTLMRLRNVHSLELPAVADDILDQKKITPAGYELPLKGTWKCVVPINNLPFTNTVHFTQDGHASICVTDPTGKILYQENGAYTLDGEGWYTYVGNIKEEGRVVWIDKDHYKYTPEKSTNPSAMIGTEFLTTRTADE